MFDPYSIYKRQVHSSHSGQVLRKKIRRKSGKVYTNEELEDAIPPLRAIGYNVRKGNFFETQITSWSDTYMIDTGSVSFIGSSVTSLSFSAIWPTIKSDFLDCLNIDPLSVVNILFEIDLLSIDLYGSYVSTGISHTFPSLYLYINDSSKRITVPYKPNGNISSSNFHVNFRSFTGSRIYFTESCEEADSSYFGYIGEISKTEFAGSPFLNIIERRQPAIIRTLRNDDYSVFDPILFNIYTSNANQSPATISHSFITAQVKMIIEHK